MSKTAESAASTSQAYSSIHRLRRAHTCLPDMMLPYRSRHIQASSMRAQGRGWRRPTPRWPAKPRLPCFQLHQDGLHLYSLPTEHQVWTPRILHCRVLARPESSSTIGSVKWWDAGTHMTSLTNMLFQQQQPHAKQACNALPPLSCAACSPRLEPVPSQLPRAELVSTKAAVVQVCPMPAHAPVITETDLPTAALPSGTKMIQLSLQSSVQLQASVAATVSFSQQLAPAAPRPGRPLLPVGPKPQDMCSSRKQAAAQAVPRPQAALPTSGEKARAHLPTHQPATPPRPAKPVSHATPAPRLTGARPRPHLPRPARPRPSRSSPIAGPRALVARPALAKPVATFSTTKFMAQLWRPKIQLAATETCAALPLDSVFAVQGSPALRHFLQQPPPGWAWEAILQQLFRQKCSASDGGTPTSARRASVGAGRSMPARVLQHKRALQVEVASARLTCSHEHSLHVLQGLWVPLPGSALTPACFQLLQTLLPEPAEMDDLNAAHTNGLLDTLPSVEQWMWKLGQIQHAQLRCELLPALATAAASCKQAVQDAQDAAKALRELKRCPHIAQFLRVLLWLLNVVNGGVLPPANQLCAAFPPGTDCACPTQPCPCLTTAAKASRKAVWSAAPSQLAACAKIKAADGQALGVHALALLQCDPAWCTDTALAVVQQAVEAIPAVHAMASHRAMLENLSRLLARTHQLKLPVPGFAVEHYEHGQQACTRVERDVARAASMVAQAGELCSEVAQYLRIPAVDQLAGELSQLHKLVCM